MRYRLLPVPDELSEIDPAVYEFHAFLLQQGDLLVHAAEGEGCGRFAEAVDDAVAGDMRGIGIDVQGVADDAAPALVAREHGDLSVGRDLAAGDPSDDVVDQFKRVFHHITASCLIIAWTGGDSNILA